MSTAPRKAPAPEPAPTPDEAPQAPALSEREKALALWVASEPGRDKQQAEEEAARRAAEEMERRCAVSALAALERRTVTATFPVTLPGGDVVPVRSRLSRAEVAEVNALFTRIGSIGMAAKVEGRARTPDEVAASEAASNRLLGLILYVEGQGPDEIEAYIAANPGTLSDPDAEEVVLSYLAMLKTEEERLKQIVDFRPE